MPKKNLNKLREKIPLLEDIGKDGRVWSDLCKQYGVENPDPPWRITLESTCEVLNEGACALPVLERRDEEDKLSEEIYKDVPYPERQLLALAHSMIKKGFFREEELGVQMEKVYKRLSAGT
ncbi:MAG: hypothetical protein CL398_06170 [Acidiferrobacteraceae bacterium]|nr:hypothetical protein [Acidiferrobacteraceae bacterium]|tara:strand:+ start:976 stop:1338 length:363 start_codon:yes stop_codon:yes gene_type:complete